MAIQQVGRMSTVVNPDFPPFPSCQSLSHVQLFMTPWTIAHQAPLSMGLSRQENWSAKMADSFVGRKPQFPLIYLGD